MRPRRDFVDVQIRSFEVVLGGGRHGRSAGSAWKSESQPHSRQERSHGEY
jgi:hypothetical protein